MDGFRNNDFNRAETTMKRNSKSHDNGNGYYRERESWTESTVSLSSALKYLSLSHTERKTAALVKHGNTTKEIAELLKLSPGMINYHRKNIRKKLGVNGKRENLKSQL